MDKSLKSDRLRTDPQHSREERKRGSGGLEEEMIHANRSEMCKKKRERERDLQGEEEERDANKWLWKKK